MRSRHLLVVGFALVSWLALPGSALADELPLCDSTVMTGCVVSVRLDGAPQTYPSTGAPYDIFIQSVDPPSAYDFNVLVRGEDGAPLDLGGEWEVALNLGAIDPGETFSRGRDVTVARGGTPTSRTVTVTFKPVRMAEGACGPSGVCADTATLIREGYLEVWIGDLSYLASPADRAAMRGFDLATNAEWVSTPLQLDYATRAIVLDVANAHWDLGPTGATPFLGSAEFRLPFPMLSRLYLVDDPASLTPAAFTATAASGPAPAVSVDVGASDVKVTMTNLTFSKRKLRIRGDVKPGRPRSVRARRTTATAGAIWFAKALPRGAKVRGYQAVCKAGKHVVRGSTAGSPVRLRGLRAGRYSCTVRAKSKAGLGRTASVTIPRR